MRRIIAGNELSNESGTTMNIIKANDKDFTVIDGGVQIGEEAKLEVLFPEGATIESLEQDFENYPEDLVIYELDGKTSVAVHKGFTELTSITKNIGAYTEKGEDANTADKNETVKDTATIVLAKKSLYTRVAALESSIDSLTMDSLGLE